jgi:cell wall-associated NlpC family hydrolase
MPLSPSALSRARKSLLARFSTVVVGTAVAATAMTMVAPAADAIPTTLSTTESSQTQQSSTQQSQMTARQRYDYKANHVLNVVSNQKGDPYRYGAAGPNAFDCSGLMYYSFQRALGRTIPRTANDQKRASTRIWHPRRNLRPGDLVFHVSGGYAGHVGIYAGHGEYWHSPHTGSHVKKDPVSYGSGWAFGRLIKS